MVDSQVVGQVVERLLIVFEALVHLFFETVVLNQYPVGTNRIRMLIWDAFESDLGIFDCVGRITYTQVYFCELGEKIRLRQRADIVCPLSIRQLVQLRDYLEFFNALGKISLFPFLLVALANLLDLGRVHVKSLGRTVNFQNVAQVKYRL